MSKHRNFERMAHLFHQDSRQEQCSLIPFHHSSKLCPNSTCVHAPAMDEVKDVIVIKLQGEGGSLYNDNSDRYILILSLIKI